MLGGVAHVDAAHHLENGVDKSLAEPYSIGCNVPIKLRTVSPRFVPVFVPIW